jgi:hypothetical protein
MKRLGALLAVACVVALAAGCKDSSQATAGGPDGIPPKTASPAASSTAPAPLPASPSPAKSSAKPAVTLRCAQLKEGVQLGGPAVKYNGYPDSIPLGDGHWSGEDGNTVDLQPQCGAGDLDGDGKGDLLGVVSLNGGGSGTFFTLVVWRYASGEPECVALLDLGDRTPVVSISVASRKATVVWLTRTPDAPMAVVNIKRTSVYQLSGATLHELSHTDAAYSG